MRFELTSITPSLLMMNYSMSRLIIAFIVVMFGFGQLVHRLADESLPNDVILLHNLRYRDDPSRQWTLDLAIPKGESAKPRAAIVVIHGGGWIEGDKSSFSTIRRRPPGNIIDFAQLGFVALAINYRLSNEAPFPAALHDCKCVVRWLRANSQKYNIDPERIGAWGNSAGGHLALLLGMTSKTEGLEGDGPHLEEPSSVQAAVSDTAQCITVRIVRKAVCHLLATTDYFSNQLIASAASPDSSPLYWLRLSALPAAA